MCFVISIVLFILSYKFYENSNTQGALLLFAIASFFAYLMIKNINKIKRDKNDN